MMFLGMVQLTSNGVEVNPSYILIEGIDNDHAQGKFNRYTDMLLQTMKNDQPENNWDKKYTTLIPAL